MCGRYVLPQSSADVAAAVGAVDTTGGDVPPSYNIAPSQLALVVVAGGDGKRRLGRLRWGIPAGGPAQRGAGHINARAETLLKGRGFRQARRCLVPAGGWYEWQRTADGRKQPHFVHDASAPLLTFAGVYDARAAAGAEPVWAYAVVTTAATPDVAHLGDRRPVVVPAELRDDWLDPTVDAPSLLGALASAPAHPLTAYPVDPRVGNVRVDGPDLLSAAGRAASDH